MIDGIELEGLEVVEINKYTTADLFLLTGEAAGGVAIGPDGVKGLATYGYGAQVGNAAGIETGFSVAIYPDMPNTDKLNGSGNTFALNFDLPTPISAGLSIGGVQALDENGNVAYESIIIKGGLGANVGLGVSVSYTWDETIVKSLGAEGKGVLKDANSMLIKVQKEIKSTLGNLYADYKKMRAEYRSYLDEEGKISKKDSRYDKYKATYDKVVRNNANIRKMKKSLEVVEKAIQESKDD